jgi:hypothetical protein
MQQAFIDHDAFQCGYSRANGSNDRSRTAFRAKSMKILMPVNDSCIAIPIIGIGSQPSYGISAW